MAIYPLHTTTIITKDVLINSPFKAGMALILDTSGRAIKADSQQLVFNSSYQKYGRFLGFSASDHDLSGNTIIVPDNVGNNYLDINNRFIKNENTEYVVPKRGLMDLQDTAVSNFYNPSDISVISKRGIGVYNTPGDYFVTDQFNPVLHGDYGFDGLDIQTINPGDLLTFGGGINAGKLVKVNVNSLGPDILVVGQVSRYNSSTGLLYFRQNSYNLSFGNYISIFYDAANITSYPRTGSTWSNLASTSYNMTLVNGPVYSSNYSGEIVFDGSDDYGTSSGFSFTNYTVEIFVNVISHNNPFGISRIFEGNTLSLALGSATYGLDDIYILSAGSGWFNSSVKLTLGQYNHMVVVKNGSLHQIYLNGASIYSNTLTNNTLSNMKLADGGSNERTRSSFGYFKIYNKVLTATEVLNQYNFNKSRYGL
jgi:hypothetical protein